MRPVRDILLHPRLFRDLDEIAADPIRIDAKIRADVEDRARSSRPLSLPALLSVLL